MLFNSFHFLLFFPISTLMYYATPVRLRWLMLLLSACYFYMAFVPGYIFILFALILVDYSAGLLIERSRGSARGLLLCLSLVANLSFLAVFKYYGFLAGNLQQLFSAIGFPLAAPVLNLILPIGLSFHTFQSMAYTIEVYRGSYPAERHLGIYAAYVLFYPQLVAGPIERPANLLPQLHATHRFDLARAGRGLRRMLWGLFKKMVVADSLALYVNLVYAEPMSYTGLPLLVATLMFSFQIYCDFSGYTDVALGAAEVLGFRLMENFRRPYLAAGISEFWHRWHISLSTWFRDYLYIPLGGNRAGSARTRLNLLLTFALSGLWHGASWNFVVWGVYHALLFSLFGLASPWLVRLPRLAAGCVTFACVTVGWVFFRASSIPEAAYVLANMGLGGWHAGMLATVAVPLLLVLWLVGVECLEEASQASFPDLIARGSPAARMLADYLMLCAVALLGRFDQRAFIYFQF